MAVVELEAKAHLRRSVEQSARGNDVVIARGGKPVARLSRLRASKTRLRFEGLTGRIKISEDFYVPLACDF